MGFRVPLHSRIIALHWGLVLCLLMAFLNCSRLAVSNRDNSRDSGQPETYSFSFYPLFGGYISTVAFHPARAGEVWLSGDDASGIYSSNNGGQSWALANGVPFNFSTYSLSFDPLDVRRIYAPSEFGRGFLYSEDEGQSWKFSRSGLPQTSPGPVLRQVALSPTTTKLLFLATNVGLYKSVDGGATFTKASTPSFTSQDIMALEWTSQGLFAGDASGGVYRSVNVGASWARVRTGSGEGVSDLKASPSALYIGLNGGGLYRTTSFTSANLQTLNDPSAGGFVSQLWTKIALLSGASVASDFVMVGTVAVDGHSDWGLFLSVNGGISFQHVSAGLEGQSIFSLAIDPFNSSHLLVGTVGGGLYQSSDKGIHWTPASSGVRAHAPVGFAVDSQAANILLSSTEGLDGTPSLIHSADGGQSWQTVTSLDWDPWSMDIDPSNAGRILLGSFGSRPGIYLSSTGPSGGWTAVLSKNVGIKSFHRDRIDANNIYASAASFTAPQTIADVGVYYSANNGQSWTHRSSLPSVFVDAHPTNRGEAVAGMEDVFTTRDFFATHKSLGFAAQFPGRQLTALVFSADGATILLGTDKGEIFKLSDYRFEATQWPWQKLALPAKSCSVEALYAQAETVIASCVAGNSDVQADTQEGFFISRDGGLTWTDLSPQMPPPCSLAMGIVPNPLEPKSFFLNLWGGGLLNFRIRDL